MIHLVFLTFGIVFIIITSQDTISYSWSIPSAQRSLRRAFATAMNLEWLVARGISAQSASRARAGVINTRTQSYWTWCPFVVEYLPSYSNVFAESRAFSFSFVVCVDWKSMYFLIRRVIVRLVFLGYWFHCVLLLVWSFLYTKLEAPQMINELFSAVNIRYVVLFAYRYILHMSQINKNVYILHSLRPNYVWSAFEHIMFLNQKLKRYSKILTEIIYGFKHK